MEIGATIFGLIQGVLVMLNKRSNWIAYILQMVLLAAFSWSMRLYGDVVSNSFYIIVGAVGWILWKQENNIPIRQCDSKERVVYILIIAFATFAGYLWLKTTNDPLPLIDSFTTVSGLVATYYMITKKLDTWILWFVNDIFYIIEYYMLPDRAWYLLSLNIIWTGMAVASYINWYNIMKKENAT